MTLTSKLGLLQAALFLVFLVVLVAVEPARWAMSLCYCVGVIGGMVMAFRAEARSISRNAG